MTRYSTTFAALALAGASAIHAPAMAAPSPQLAQVQRHLKAVQTMTAKFSQVDRDGKVLTGTLTLKRPGRIRFQYQPGVPLLIVGDGKALTMIDYQVKQVSRWPVGQSPLAILVDPDKDLAGIAHVAPGPGGSFLVEGRDPKHPEFGTISIGFTPDANAPAGLMLRGWTVLDAQGNRSSVTLSDQKFNVPVGDEAFRWRDPRKQGPRA